MKVRALEFLISFPNFIHHYKLINDYFFMLAMLSLGEFKGACKSNVLLYIKFKNLNLNFLPSDGGGIVTKYGRKSLNEAGRCKITNSIKFEQIKPGRERIFKSN